MGRVYATHVLVGSAAQGQLVPADGADVKTIVAPAEAVGVYLSAKAASARITFDGSAPTGVNGLIVVAGAQPIYFPIGEGHVLKAVSEVASASELNYLWLA